MRPGTKVPWQGIRGSWMPNIGQFLVTDGGSDRFLGIPKSNRRILYNISGFLNVARSCSKVSLNQWTLYGTESAA